MSWTLKHGAGGGRRGGIQSWWVLRAAISALSGEVTPAPNKWMAYIVSLLFAEADHLDAPSGGPGVYVKRVLKWSSFLLHFSPFAPYTCTYSSLKTRIPQEEYLARQQPQDLWWLQVRKTFPRLLLHWVLLECVCLDSCNFGFISSLDESCKLSPCKQAEFQKLVTSR